jgi:hypothetical protein
MDDSSQLNRAKDRRILVQRPVSPDAIVIIGIGIQTPAQMGLAKTRMWSKHSRRIDPISRLAKQFCQGEAGAIGIVPRAPDKRLRQRVTAVSGAPGHPSARPWRSVGCLGTPLREVLSSLREA